MTAPKQGHGPGECWRQVGKDDFYGAIAPINCHPRIVEPWPYTSMFETPSRQIVGKAELYFPEGSGLTSTRYWLPIEGVSS